MSPGVPAFLSILALITLWLTGWFSRLPRDLGLTSGNELFGWLLSASVCSVVEIPISPAATLHLGVLWLLCAFLRLMQKVPSPARYSSGVALFFFGFTLYFAGELMVFDPAWIQFSLQHFSLALLIGLTLLVTPRLERRLVVLTGGMFLGMILSAVSFLSANGVFRIGSAVGWDLLWLSLIALTSIHYFLLWVERKLLRFRAKL